MTQLRPTPPPSSASDDKPSTTSQIHTHSGLPRPDPQSEAIWNAAESGDVAGARQMILKLPDEKRRQSMLDRLNYQLAVKALKEDQINQAAGFARQIKHSFIRVELLKQIGEHLADRDQHAEALKYFSEAHVVLSRIDPSPRKAHALLSLISVTVGVDSDRAMEFTQSVVLTQNKLHQLTRKSDTSAKQGRLNLMARQSLYTHLEMTFTQLGKANLEQAVYWAVQLQDPEQRVLAEIAACRPVLDQLQTKTPQQ